MNTAIDPIALWSAISVRLEAIEAQIWEELWMEDPEHAEKHWWMMVQRRQVADDAIITCARQGKQEQAIELVVLFLQAYAKEYKVWFDHRYIRAMELLLRQVSKGTVQ